MKRITGSVVLLVALALSLPGQAKAQFIWFGVGGSFPTGDFKEYANTGFLTSAGVGFPVAEKVSIYGEGFFGQNNHETEGDKTTPFGFMAGAEVDLAPDAAGVYFFGGLGVMVHKFSSDQFESDSSSGLAFEGGGGVDFPLNDNVNGWVEGRFMNASIESENTSFLGALAGISVNVGSY